MSCKRYSPPTKKLRLKLNINNTGQVIFFSPAHSEKERYIVLHGTLVVRKGTTLQLGARRGSTRMGSLNPKSNLEKKRPFRTDVTSHSKGPQKGEIPPQTRAVSVVECRARGGASCPLSQRWFEQWHVTAMSVSRG